MYSKKVKFRFLFIFVFLALIAITTFTVLKVLKDNVVYFKSPSEINLLTEISSKKIRVGGMVKKDSVIMNNNKINFIITDFKKELYVKPIIFNMQYGGKDAAETQSFPVYRESANRLYIPRFYGIQRYGIPIKEKLQIGDNIQLEFSKSYVS